MPEKQQHLLKFIVFSGPGGSRTKESAKVDICVGRLDPAEPLEGPDVDLKDPWVSRKHARVWKSQGKWFIEDLGSKRGTLVDGEEIRGRGPVELVPGMPVVTGRTTWTIIPRDWLFVRWQDVIIFAPCAKGINHALYHCRTPILGTVTAGNFGQRKSTPLHLRLQVEGFSDPYDIEIPSLDPAGFVSLGTPIIRLHAAKLRSQTELVQAQLTVEVNRRRDSSATKELTILGFWAWSYDKTARKTIATFVSPRNPIVEQRIVHQAQAKMESKGGVNSFDQLIRSGRDDAEKIVLEALYRYLRDRCIIKWHRPESQGYYQIIRPPHRIFPPNLPTLEGKATCIDLALLMASCLENTGLCPVIVLTGKKALEIDPRDCHAFAGCWAGPAPGSRPVRYDREFLQREVKARNLFVVECTGFAEGLNRDGGKLSFSEAVKSAQDQLADEPWVCVIDIGALRQEPDSISPMDCPLSPEVARAYKEAELFAKRKRSEVIETTFLFYGCLTVNGEVLRWLLGEAGINPGHIRDSIDKLVSTRSFSGESSPTRNYSDCQRLAEEIAWKSGSPSICEQDVLWAILNNAPNSKKFSGTCRELRIDLDRLAALLSGRYPPPDIPGTFTSFTSGPEE